MQEQILQIKWQGREFEVHIPTTATLGELKLQIEALTNVSLLHSDVLLDHFSHL